MNHKRTEAKERDRKSALIRETATYGGAAVVFAGLAAALWFLQRPVGIAAVIIVAAFAAVAIANFAVGFLVYRSFVKMSKDPAVPFAYINEYGHLELFGGKPETAQKYAEFSATAYGKMYRPVGERPGSDEIKGIKAEQKRIRAEEKALAAQLSPRRQFDRFTPADLAALQGKTVFVSERVFRFAAEEADWQKARENNEIVIIPGNEPGQKTER